MKHIVVDLEMNNISQKSEARRLCSMEIIEIGAVMLDERLEEISSFRTYVKPEYNRGIIRKISRLTGITDEMVLNAPKFNAALRMFTDWCLGNGDEVTVYAWSNSDYNQIMKEMLLKNYPISPEEEKLLTVAWTDFQKEFDSDLGFERQISLKLALHMAGINFSGKEHHALDDARNTAELLQIFRDEELFHKTLGKIKEALEPTPINFALGDIIDFSAFACA
ncbi:MAG: 3'-5' exonuclease [Johnsonella sp.]|nr:3'-5' exonuclease [Johnsonella sp.]